MKKKGYNFDIAYTSVL